jgi:hypothetical protein
MSSNPDLSRFPNAAKYLAALPKGLDSHPEAQVNSDVLDPLWEAFPDVVTRLSLPPELVAIATVRQVGGWLPEVLGNCLLLACHDGLFKTTPDFMKWAYGCRAKVYDKAAYRLLMHVLSPTLLAMGAAKRWAAFHRGSTLTPHPVTREGPKTIVKGTLSYPLNLYTPLLLQYIGQAFTAAFAAGHASGITTEIASTTPTEALFISSWA